MHPNKKKYQLSKNIEPPNTLNLRDVHELLNVARYLTIF